MATRLAAWAARYARVGLAVLPLHSICDGRCTCGRGDCPSPGKHPRTPHGKDDATADLRQVAAWWQRWPWANVGVRPPAGLLVLDVDPRNGGAVMLAELIREHGRLPQTLRARTGSGGLHIWLAYGGRARGRLCPGVDVKTHCGYVVAPPSLHVSGGRYEWLKYHRTAPAPRWVRRLLDPPPPPAPVRPVTGGTIDHLARFVTNAPEGERNTRLYWACCRAYEQGLGTEALIAGAVAIGYPERAARRTARSAANAPRRAGVTFR